MAKRKQASAMPQAVPPDGTPRRPPCVPGCQGQVSHSIAEPNPELRVHTLTCGRCGAAASYEQTVVAERDAGHDGGN